MKQFQENLKRLDRQTRLRSLPMVETCGVDLTSNDSLGFATHPMLREAAGRFFQDGGAVGAGASRLLRGNHGAHLALEDYAAPYFGAERALYFSSGFQANHAVLSSLPARGDMILFDALIHASSRVGLQASLARHMRVAHNDVEAYEEALQRARGMVKGQLWIVVESVYSMEGDFVPLEALYALAVRYDAILIIDEAHGVGVYGPTGRGLSEDLIAAQGYERIITVHPCGKALGGAGGLVCAQASVIDYLINVARGFVYSTAPLPVQAYLVQAALGLLQSEGGQARRVRLAALRLSAQRLLGGAGSHIVPVMIGDDERAVAVAAKMQQQGFHVSAIRPPTIPEGTARLRVSLNVGLDDRHLDAFAGALDLAMGAL